MQEGKGHVLPPIQIYSEGGDREEVKEKKVRGREEGRERREKRREDEGREQVSKRGRGKGGREGQ